ncbi:MFS transporter [Chloroflexota bacterium]
MIRKAGVITFFASPVALFMLAHFSHHLINSLLQPLLPFIRDDFGMNYTQAAWIVSAFTFAYGISQLPAGWLADRIGSRFLLLIGTVGVAICGLLIGFSPTYSIMVVFLVLLGILGGGYHPAASPLVSASVEEKNRGRALGIHQIGGTGSFFLSPIIAVGVAGFFGGWRASFIILAVITVLFSTFFYIRLSRRLSSSQPEYSSNAANKTDSIPVSGSMKRLVAFIILGVTLQISIFSATSFIPLYAVDHFMESEAIGAALLSVAHFSGLWAGPLGGYISDRIGKVPVMLTVCLLAGPVIFLLSLVSMNITIWAVLLVLGALMYVGMPVTESYVITHSPEKHRSTILGIYYFASRGGPALIMPVFGSLLDYFSFGMAFTATGVAALVITLGCSLFLWGSREKQH